MRGWIWGLLSCTGKKKPEDDRRSRLDLQSQHKYLFLLELYYIKKGDANVTFSPVQKETRC